MRRSGYVRVRVDGKILDLSDEIELDKQKKHTIEVVVDRLVIRKGQRSSASPNVDGHAGEQPPYRMVAERPALYDVNAQRDTENGRPGSGQEEDSDASFRQRVADSLETTLKLGNGVVLVSIIDGEEILFSEKFACVYCGISLPEIAPRTFSFNSPHGACSTCTGLGTQLEIDAELIVTHPELSIRDGAIAAWCKEMNNSKWCASIAEAMAEKYHFSLNTPWRDLSEEQRQLMLYGTTEALTIRYRPQHGNTRS